MYADSTLLNAHRKYDMWEDACHYSVQTVLTYDCHIMIIDQRISLWKYTSYYMYFQIINEMFELTGADVLKIFGDEKNAIFYAKANQKKLSADIQHLMLESKFCFSFF